MITLLFNHPSFISLEFQPKLKIHWSYLSFSFFILRLQPLRCVPEPHNPTKHCFDMKSSSPPPLTCPLIRAAVAEAFGFFCVFFFPPAAAARRGSAA